ncbi:MAG: PKD domain-containing protein [Bacteroidetes bacterium]|nr:PKD domain-containing protein [Bacteroidota bacterium]
MTHFLHHFRIIVCTVIFGLGFVFSSQLFGQVPVQSHLRDTTTSLYGDSLIGFNMSAVLQLATSKHLSSVETEYFIHRCERRFIIHQYNLPIPPRNTGLNGMRIPDQVANGPCTNMDFEQGTFAGWAGFIGDNTVSSQGPLQNIVNGIVTAGNNAAITNTAARHTIMANPGAGTDFYGGFPCVAPGGNYSVRLGNDGNGNPNYEGEGIQQTFTVSNSNTAFTYDYAVVLEDGGHSAQDQPYFRIQMFDQSSNLIPCSDYYVHASNAIPGFVQSPVLSDTYYKPWSTVNVDLSSYVGQNVTIFFTAASCTQGAHFGYAYIDASCNPYQIVSNDTLCQGSSIVLSAPIGAASYLWSPGGQTTQNITVNSAGSYSVNMTSMTGCHTILTRNIAIYPSPVASFNSNAPPCTSTFTFNNTSTLSSGTMTYSWNFGDPSILSDTSHLANPTYTYTSSGTFTVTLITTSASGCSDTITQIVSPGSGGVAAFLSTTVCQNTATTFTDQSASASSWAWNFGDPASGPGNTSALQNPTHLFTAAGTYTVTLTVGSLPCPSTITHIITVNPLPTPSMVFNQVCQSSLVNFSSTSVVAAPSTITVNAWDFGDPASGGNNTSALLNPSHTFTATGTYTVTLVVTTSDGCPQTITQVITVLPPPTSAFISNVVCSNAPMQFTNQSLNATVYHWDFGVAALTNDTSNLTNPTYTYTAAGTYTVTLTANPGPCAVVSTLTVTVAPGPQVLFTSPQVCFGFQSAFTDQSNISSGVITNWSWNFGVAAVTNDTSNLQNPNYQFPAAGTYTVSLTCTSNNGCVSTQTVPITVNPIPTANFTSNIVCQGVPSTLTDISIPATGTITNWQWNFGDASANSTQQNPSHTYGNDTTFNVTLIVTNTAGCIDTVILPVVVASLPVVVFTADTFAGCPPLCVNFLDQTTTNSGTITGWTWDFGDNSPASSTQNPLHCFTQTGTYSVTLTAVSSGGCNNTLVIPNMITVYPVPHASFSASPLVATILNPSIDFVDLSSGNPVTWQWNFGDPTTFGDTSNVPNNTYTYSSEYGDTYPVHLIVTNQFGCVDDTTVEIIIEPDFAFFIPNAFTPNGDFVNDGFYGTGYGIEKYEIWIFDRWGNMIFNTRDINEAWDGSVQGSNGEMAQIDVYVWKVVLTDVFNKKHKYIGHVSLIK